jgi:glycosyltransferase involved in cell wall biosynthesis
MKIGVVAIGRNEGQRLRVCLTSALRDAQQVVYVDSGSSDDSVALAKSLGATVVQLDLSIPFTAARSRNAGFSKLLELAPDLDAVQFVDGDCEIVEGWIANAKEQLRAKPQAAVVCGRRRERYPDKTIYNRLCDLEWNTPIGIAKSCGGDALIRVEAFKQVNGYDNDVIAGEEPEMCVRLRAKGWEIHRIDAEMTLHDAAMTRFSQWWKRNFRAGHAYAEGNARHGAPPENFRSKEVRSNFIWGLLLWWALPVLALKIYLSEKRRMNSGDARMYAIFVSLSKIPQALGQLKFWYNHRRGKRTELIEYKGPAIET